MKEKTTELIAQLKSNAVEAFDRLIEHYGDRLYWHIRRVVVQHEDAEDVLQETFTRAYLSIGDFRGDNESSLTAWLYRIATSFAIKSLRRSRATIFSSLDSVRGDLLASFNEEVEPSADEIEVVRELHTKYRPTLETLPFVVAPDAKKIIES